MAKLKQKRTYLTNPQDKINNGKPWTFHFVIDPDVAEKLIEEKENSPTGAEFGKLINARLRKSYGIKKAKKMAA